MTCKGKLIVGVLAGIAAFCFVKSYPLCVASSASYNDGYNMKLEQRQDRARQSSKGRKAIKKYPIPISKYTAEAPANLSPVLQWEKYEGAVVYELEIFDQGKRLIHDAYIYINGYNVKLPASFSGNKFSWRVRALNFDRKPISEFSKEETVFLDRNLSVVLKPVPTSTFGDGNGHALLYPAFNWIPINGVRNYQVEILKDLPYSSRENADSRILLGSGFATGFDWYADDKYVSYNKMYWRVRGISPEGKPIGEFSEPLPFMVNPQRHYWVATFGDSITHGGGNLSYSPADWEYSYQHYLNFESINLACSGDTSESSAKRFEQDVLPFRPKFLLIMTGSNSLRGEASSASVIRDLEEIKNKCLKNNICPIFITLPPINPENIQKAFGQWTDPEWPIKFKEVNNYIRQQNHIDLSCKINLTETLPTRLATDGLHLDIEGKRLMAEAINEQLPEIVKKQQASLAKY